MGVETTKMSAKGQVVIPFDVRESISAGEGTVFAVVAAKDTVVLKKIETPSKEELMAELKEIAIEGKARLQKKGFRESDIPKIVERSRRGN